MCLPFSLNRRRSDRSSWDVGQTCKYRPAVRVRIRLRPNHTGPDRPWWTTYIHLLLLEDLLLMFSPDVHELSGLVDLHGVVHQPIHIDELHPPLLRVIHHGRDDRQLTHLLLIILRMITQEHS